MLQPRALGFLNHLVPLVSVSNYYLIFLLDVPISNSSSSNTDRRAIVGGTIGGVIVLLVISNSSVVYCDTVLKKIL